MSNIVLARKYRPQNFQEVVGQQHVTKTLANSLKLGIYSPAYLFSGPRGVGKTTMARLLAKALNCVKSPQICNECPACREITSGSSLDVLEIDGASNRGIDEVRALRDNVKFAPSTLRHKVYIIDEAHQITGAAFNALLKTLEEPPAYITFILATTEPHKIPATILSRCQHYNFHLLTIDQIIGTLKDILTREKIIFSEDALREIAKAARGSMRDALSLCDQAIVFSNRNITYQAVSDLLGLLPQEAFYQIVENIAQQENKKNLQIIEKIVNDGYDLIQFSQGLVDIFRAMLLISLGVENPELTAEQKIHLANLSKNFNPAQLIRILQILTRTLDELHWTTNQQILLEISLVRIAEPYAAITELLKRLESPAPSTTKTQQIPAQPTFSQPAESEKSETAALSGDYFRLWEELLKILGQKRNYTLIQIVRQVNPVSFVNNTLKVICPGKFTYDGIIRNQSTIEQLLKEISRQDIKISPEQKSLVKPIETTSAPKPVTAEKTPEPELELTGGIPTEEENTAPDLVAPSEAVKKVLNYFPGKIKSENKLK